MNWLTLAPTQIPSASCNLPCAKKTPKNMARLQRLLIAGHPHLLMQRARPDAVVYRDEEDVEELKQVLHDTAKQTALDLHAYVLLPDRWMLLVTPANAQAASKLMQGVGRRYVRHVNRRHGLCGSLWASRFSSTVIEGAEWTLPCMTYLDTAPIRAGLVQLPHEHVHGSHCHYIGLHHDRSLMAPAAVWGMGNTPFAREAAYAEMVHRGLEDGQLKVVEHAVHHGWALGSAAFIHQLQSLTERRLSPRPRGRPRRVTDKRMP